MQDGVILSIAKRELARGNGKYAVAAQLAAFRLTESELDILISRAHKELRLVRQVKVFRIRGVRKTGKFPERYSVSSVQKNAPLWYINGVLSHVEQGLQKAIIARGHEVLGITKISETEYYITAL